MTLIEERPDKTPGQRMSFKDFAAWQRWYNHKRLTTAGRPASRHTLRTKAVHLARSANAVGAVDEVSFSEALADRRRVNTLLGTLAASMTPGAMRQTVYALIDFGRYAVEMGYVPSVALTHADVPPKNPRKPISVYSPEEMAAFVSAARGKGLRWYAFMAFLADTGRRVGEALALEWTWLRLDQRPPYFQLPTTKNGEPQYIPLTRRLATEVFTPENIERLKQDNKKGRLAFRRDPEVYVFPWSYGTAYNDFAYFCKQAGLPNRGFHNFRHTVITHRLASGMPLQAVSKLAGHSTPAITSKMYDHTNALMFADLIWEADDSR